MLLWIAISSVHIFTVLSDSIPGYHGPKSGARNRMTSLRLRLSTVSKNVTV